jgi:hypothetical protein
MTACRGIRSPMPHECHSPVNRCRPLSSSGTRTSRSQWIGGRHQQVDPIDGRLADIIAVSHDPSIAVDPYCIHQPYIQIAVEYRERQVVHGPTHVYEGAGRWNTGNVGIGRTNDFVAVIDGRGTARPLIDVPQIAEIGERSLLPEEGVQGAAAGTARAADVGLRLSHRVVVIIEPVGHAETEGLRRPQDTEHAEIRKYSVGIQKGVIAANDIRPGRIGESTDRRLAYDVAEVVDGG